MAEMDEGIRRYFLIISILFIIACIGYLLAVHFLEIDTEVMKDRFRNADELFRGEAPVTEYPPFALVFMIFPRIFASTPFGYNIGYVAEVCVFMMLGLYVICKLAKRFDYSEKKSMLAYAVLILLMLEFVVDRYDIFPAVLTLLSFYCFTTKRYSWAFVLLSLGTMTKLYPAVLFPIYLIPFILEKDWKGTLKGTAAFVVTALAVVIPVLIVEPDMITNFIEYHSDRPLHIESVAASLIYPFSMLGITDVWIEYSFGSDNLLGAWPDAVAPFMMPAMILSIVLVYAVYAHMLHRTDMGKDADDRMFLLGASILVVLMLFMVVGKVFSSQYLIWIIPPLLFMFMTNADEGSKRNMFLTVLLMIVLTQINFAYNVGYLGGGTGINDIGMFILLARNLVAVLFTCYVVKIVWDRFKARSATAAGRGSNDRIPQ